MPDSPKLPEADVQRIRALGSVLVVRLHGVLRGIKLYDAGNRALDAQQVELLAALHAMRTDEVSVLGLGEYLYVNGVRLRPEGSQDSVFRSLMSEFEARRLGGLRFGAGLEKAELEAFLRAFHSDRSETSATTLEEEAALLGAHNIWAIRARQLDTGEPGDGDGSEDTRDRHRTRLVFQRAVHATSELMQRTARTGRPALQQARRVVQTLVDHLRSSPDSLVEFTALKQHDEYTYAHCVNVSILSIRMGQVLGLTRAELAGIGVAGLLHDTGKISVPAEVLGRAGQLDEAEWAAFRRHPVEGLRIVSHLPGVSELMLDAMRVAFEHHMNVDHSGYPPVNEPRELGGFSRVVAVADFFDSVTSHRSDRDRALTGHEALRVMLGNESAKFDRAALRALVCTVGLYPVGTLLRTESGKLLLSVAPNPDSPHRPVCRPLEAGAEGGIVAIPGDATLDENERISRVLGPEDVNVDVQALLAA